MSSWGVPVHEPEAPARRVRDEVKDGVAVVVASVIASALLATFVALVSKLAG